MIPASVIGIRASCIGTTRPSTNAAPSATDGSAGAAAWSVSGSICIVAASLLVESCPVELRVHVRVKSRYRQEALDLVRVRVDRRDEVGDHVAAALPLGALHLLLDLAAPRRVGRCERLVEERR